MKKIFLVLIIIVVLFLIYNSIIYQGPFEGKVLDAITKQPIENLDISFTYRLTRFCIGVDICPSHVVKELKIYTDKGGNYKIPWFLSFKIPLIDSGPQISIFFPISDIRYQTHFVEKYYFERIDTARFSDKYPIDIKSSFSKQKIDVLLVPKLKDSIQQCELIEEIFSKEKCKTLNSWDLALEKKDINFCYNLNEDIDTSGNKVGERVDCINRVYEKLAVESKDTSFCYKIEKGGMQGEYSKEYFIEDCIAKVNRISLSK